MVAEPTIDEIRAMAARYNLVLKFSPELYLDQQHGLRPLSKAAQDARRPLPPEVLVKALQDTLPRAVGKTRPARTARSLTMQFPAPDARLGSGK